MRAYLAHLSRRGLAAAASRARCPPCALLPFHPPRRHRRGEPGARRPLAEARAHAARLADARRGREAVRGRRDTRAEGGFRALRDHAIVELFYATGMRLSELQQLDVDLDLVADQVPACAARGARSASCRSAAPPSRAAPLRAAPPDVMPRRTPTATAGAFPIRARPAPFGRQIQNIVRGSSTAGCRRCRPLHPLASPLLRHAPPRRRRRPPRGQGAPRPRVALHHPHLHAHVEGAAEAGVRPGPPPRLTAGATARSGRRPARYGLCPPTPAPLPCDPVLVPRGR
jgi:hypothetical protein